MTPARLRGSSCTTDIGSRTSGGIGINYIRNSFLPEISRSVPLFVVKQRSTVYFFWGCARFHTHTHTCSTSISKKHVNMRVNLRIGSSMATQSKSGVAMLHSPMEIPFLVNFPTLAITWHDPSFALDIAIQSIRGKNTQNISTQQLDRNGAYMRTCSICNLFVASFARTHCPTSLLPSNTFSPRRPTLR